MAATGIVAVEIEGGAGIHIGRHPHPPEVRVVPEPDVEHVSLGGAEGVGGQVPEPNGAVAGRQGDVAPVAL